MVSLFFGREEIYVERSKALIGLTLQDPELAPKIGEAAGMLAMVRYGATAREIGRAMRESLASIYSLAIPHVYVCGGASVLFGALNSVHRYCIQDQRWETIPPMPTARRLCAAAAVGGRLYVLGGEFEELGLYQTLGWQHYRQIGTVERFCPFRDSWEVMPDMPTCRAGCAAAATGGLIYVIGGRIGDTVGRASERFDTACSRWEKLPALPTARSGCSAVSLAGCCYVIGGKGLAGEIEKTVERFDPSIGWWQRLPPLQMQRSACAAGALGGRVFVAGGFNGTQGVSSVEAFDPEVGVWEEQSPMLTWRIGACCATANGKLFILGGKATNMSEHCECFDPSIKSWTWITPMPERHVYCAGAATISVT